MSIRFQADNDLNFAIVKAVRRMQPAIDIASAHDCELDGRPDAEVLDRAATTGRVLISHDLQTMPDHFRSRSVSGDSSPGLLLALQSTPVRAVAESIVLVSRAAEQEELRDQVRNLPSLVRHVFPR